MGNFVINSYNSAEIKDKIELADLAIELAERLDFLDIQILRKFYMVEKNEYPFTSQPYCFPILYREMKTNHKIKIGMEALRKRVEKLVKIGMLNKIKHSNPVSYGPIKEKEPFVKAVITKFFLINGLTKFL